jgi:EAL domain-containing protein (putative c-di-GMP-specific phosphodiesterase class I)
MYRAKVRESKFETYRKDIDDEGSRLRLGEELTLAVRSGDLILHYQPQLDLRTGEVVSVEALLRWPHPRLGLVPPLEFLPLAEEAGLMQSLTSQVLEQALAQCQVWWSMGRRLVVAINISVSNLLDPEFVDLVRSRLSHYRLPASALVVEITETSVITDFERCKVVIARLRDMGIVVSIDDFGAGFTSLAYLGDLAVGELKLDRTFITRLRSLNGRDLALVRATVDLAHTQGLRVVAEGIEDGPTLDLLTGIGCDVGQGYFIGRPALAAELAVAPDGAALGPAAAEPVAS